MVGSEASVDFDDSRSDANTRDRVETPSDEAEEARRQEDVERVKRENEEKKASTALILMNLQSRKEDFIVRPRAPQQSIYFQRALGRRVHQQEMNQYYHDLASAAAEARQKKLQRELQFQNKILEEDKRRTYAKEHPWMPPERLTRPLQRNAAKPPEPAVTTPRPSSARSGQDRCDKLYNLSKRPHSARGPTKPSQDASGTSPRVTTKAFIDRFYDQQVKSQEHARAKVAKKYLETNSILPQYRETSYASGKRKKPVNVEEQIQRLGVQDVKTHNVAREQLLKKRIPAPPPAPRRTPEEVAERMYTAAVRHSEATMERLRKALLKESQQRQVHPHSEPLTPSRVEAMAQRLSTPSPNRRR